MLYKCLSVTFPEIFTNFGGTVSGPVVSLGSVCLRRVLKSATWTLEKWKGIEKSKLLLIFGILGRLVFSNDPYNYFLSITCVNNIDFLLTTRCFLYCVNIMGIKHFHSCAFFVCKSIFIPNRDKIIVHATFIC